SRGWPGRVAGWRADPRWRPASRRGAGPRSLPPAVDPLLEMGCLVADRRLVAVAGQHDRGRGQLREQALLDRADDRGEVAAGELRGARSTGEQRVAAEHDPRALDEEAHRTRRVARRVDRAQPQSADLD